MTTPRPPWWGDLYDADDEHLPIDTLGSLDLPLPLPAGFQPASNTTPADR